MLIGVGMLISERFLQHTFPLSSENVQDKIMNNKKKPRKRKIKKEGKYIYSYAYTHAGMYTYMHICTYMHVCTHMHTHTYTHTIKTLNINHNIHKTLQKYLLVRFGLAIPAVYKTYP